MAVKWRERHWPTYRPPVQTHPNDQRAGPSLQTRKRNRNLNHQQGAATDPDEEGAGSVAGVGAALVGVPDEVPGANGSQGRNRYARMRLFRKDHAHSRKTAVSLTNEMTRNGPRCDGHEQTRQK